MTGLSKGLVHISVPLGDVMKELANDKNKVVNFVNDLMPLKNDLADFIEESNFSKSKKDRMRQIQRMLHSTCMDLIRETWQD